MTQRTVPLRGGLLFCALVSAASAWYGYVAGREMARRELGAVVLRLREELQQERQQNGRVLRS